MLPTVLTETRPRHTRDMKVIMADYMAALVYKLNSVECSFVLHVADCTGWSEYNVTHLHRCKGSTACALSANEKVNEGRCIVCIVVVSSPVHAFRMSHCF